MKWVSERGMARTISHPWRSHQRGIRDAFPKLQWGILALTFCTCFHLFTCSQFAFPHESPKNTRGCLVVWLGDLSLAEFHYVVRKLAKEVSQKGVI